MEIVESQFYVHFVSGLQFTEKHWRLRYLWATDWAKETGKVGQMAKLHSQPPPVDDASGSYTSDLKFLSVNWPETNEKKSEVTLTTSL